MEVLDLVQDLGRQLNRFFRQAFLDDDAELITTETGDGIVTAQLVLKKEG